MLNRRVEAARRMTKTYDFVVTSGGIGPTHDGSSMLWCPVIFLNPTPARAVGVYQTHTRHHLPVPRRRVLPSPNPPPRDNGPHVGARV